jgi:HSP20 family molecular chaperone IbpA
MKIFEIKTAYPGTSKKDILITETDRNVSVTVKDKKGFTVSVDKDYDLETLKAEYKDGLLTITAKPLEKETRTIKIT